MAKALSEDHVDHLQSLVRPEAVQVPVDGLCQRELGPLSDVVNPGTVLVALFAQCDATDVLDVFLDFFDFRELVVLPAVRDHPHHPVALQDELRDELSRVSVVGGGSNCDRARKDSLRVIFRTRR